MREKNIAEIRKVLEEIVGKEATVTFRKVKKNNGLELLGVTVAPDNRKIVPTIYIDEFLKNMETGHATAESVADYVINMFDKHKNCGYEDVINTFSKEFILENVQYQLINAEKNEERLESAPHKDFADLAAIYRIVLGETDGETGSIFLQDNLIQAYGINFEELDEAARKNTEKSGFKIQSIAAVMSEMTGMPEETFESEEMIYVASNEGKIFGATIMLYPKRFAEIAEKLEDNLYILPSSVHEVLVMKMSNVKPEDLIAIVRDVNDTQVADDEILSYSIYEYCRETGKVEVAV